MSDTSIEYYDSEAAWEREIERAESRLRQSIIPKIDALIEKHTKEK